MTVAVIPVRSFRFGKQRLASVLSDDQRHLIGVGMTERVVGAVLEAGMTPLVVTADTDVDTWAATKGIGTVADPGIGLNGAVAAGVAAVVEDRWLVIHSDLPLIQPTDLNRLASAIVEGRDVIAPSSDGGTSAISAKGTVEFAYGEASFHRHLPRLDKPVVVTRVGLLHDLDTVDDLASARRHRRGRWLDGIY